MSHENELIGAGPLSESQILIAGCGARRIMNGIEAAYDFGFIRSSPGQLDGMIRDHDPNEDVPEIVGDVICLWEDSRAGFRRDPLYSWQLSGSCFPAGTPVRMADGSEQSIETVKVGDRVVSHTGKSRKVNHVMSRSYSGDMVTVHIKGHPFPIKATADHPFAVWRAGELVWVDAGELEMDDHVIIAGVDGGELQTLDCSEAIPEPEYNRPDKADKWLKERGCHTGDGRIGVKQSRTANRIFRTISVTASFARLVGLYLAEGGTEGGRVTFTFSRDESNLAEEVVTLIRGCFGVESEVTYQDSRPSVCQVRCANVNVAAVLKWLIPGNVYTKRVPSILFRSPKPVREAVIRGWLDGDGHVRDKVSFSVTGVSVCPGLIRDMLSLSISCGIAASVHRRPAMGRSRESYGLHLTGKATSVLVGVQPKHAVADTPRGQTPFGLTRTVSRVVRESVESLPVYDFEVEEDHSFTVNGVVVHNCVNSGGFNASTTRIGIESLYLPDPETPIQAFTLAAYGASRYAAFRDDTEGEGSTGDAMARALGDFGFTSIDDPACPKYSVCGPAIVYDRPIELKFSRASNCPPLVKANCKQHNLQYVSVRSAEEGRAELRRRRPLTFAGDWGGLMECEYRGEPRVLMNRRVGTWNHQQTCLGAWFHPTLGWIYFILNNWYFPVSGGDLKYTTIRTREGTAINTITVPGLAKSVHGLVTRNEPAGGYWISEKDFDYQCRTGEVRGLMNVRGFVDRPIGPGNI